VELGPGEGKRDLSRLRGFGEEGLNHRGLGQERSHKDLLLSPTSFSLLPTHCSRRFLLGHSYSSWTLVGDNYPLQEDILSS
jgi:hypothetical protein